MVEEAEKEELYQAIQSMVASGMSIKARKSLSHLGRLKPKRDKEDLTLEGAEAGA